MALDAARTERQHDEAKATPRDQRLAGWRSPRWSPGRRRRHAAGSSGGTRRARRAARGGLVGRQHDLRPSGRATRYGRDDGKRTTTAWLPGRLDGTARQAAGAQQCGGPRADATGSATVRQLLSSRTHTYAHAARRRPPPRGPSWRAGCGRRRQRRPNGNGHPTLRQGSRSPASKQRRQPRRRAARQGDEAQRDDGQDGQQRDNGRAARSARVAGDPCPVKDLSQALPSFRKRYSR